MGFMILSTALCFCVIYVWSKRNPEADVRFFFGIRLKGSQVPFALLAFSILLGDSIVLDLAGLFAGHVYYFLQEVLPEHNPLPFGPRTGLRLLKTPHFMYVSSPTHTTPPTDVRPIHQRNTELCKVSISRLPVCTAQTPHDGHGGPHGCPADGQSSLCSRPPSLQ